MKLKLTFSNLRVPLPSKSSGAPDVSYTLGLRSIISNNLEPHVEALAKEFTNIPIWRTGICKIVMKAKNSANFPTLISSFMTFWPPIQRTNPIAKKNEKLITVVLPTLTFTRFIATSRTLADAPSNFLSS